MLEVVTPSITALVQGRWVSNTKARHGSEIIQAFMKFDADGSGGIDVDEFVVAAAGANSKLDEVQLRELFAAADRDHNGQLDLEEFMAMSATSAELRKVFHDILKVAGERKQQQEAQRLATFLKHPTICSPSGRKRRPSLLDIRKLEDVNVPVNSMWPTLRQLKPNDMKMTNLVSSAP